MPDGREGPDRLLRQASEEEVTPGCQRRLFAAAALAAGLQAAGPVCNAGAPGQLQPLVSSLPRRRHRKRQPNILAHQAVFGLISP